MNSVAIVGAGFSRAAFDAMPLTDELGNVVIGRLRTELADLPDLTFAGGTFETWLSRLAEPQPDLTDEVNLQHQHWFSALTRAVCDVLAARESAAAHVPVPWWLQRFLAAAHADGMTIATFNYDTLVERAVDRMLLIDRDSGYRATSEHIVNFLPPAPPGLYQYPPGEADTFKLLKLHGSVNTFWVPGDRTGATIVRLPLWALTEESARARYAPGRTPFVVPPAAAKTAHYDNPVTRESWRRVSSALGGADHVALLGYSLPITDLVTSGMLGDRLRGSNAHVHVANPAPDEVVERLERLGVSTNITIYDGPDAIARYVDEELEPRAALGVLAQLLARDPLRPVAVGRSAVEYETCWIHHLCRVGPVVELIVGAVNDKFTLYEAPDFVREPPTVRDIADVAEGATHLRVRYGNGEVAAIYAVVDADPEGAAIGEWLMLVPTAFPGEPP